MSEAGVGAQSLQGFLADWDASAASAPIQDGMDGMVTTRMTLHSFRIGDPELKLFFPLLLGGEASQRIHSVEVSCLNDH